MPNRNINLRVIKLEYNIPAIHIDIPKEKIRNGRPSKGNYTIPAHILEKYKSMKKYIPIPDVKINKLPQPSLDTLMEGLLREIYTKRRYLDNNCLQDTLESETSTSITSYYTLDEDDIRQFDLQDIRRLVKNLERRCQQVGGLLAKKLCTRDLLKRRRKHLNSAITVFLHKIQYEQGDEGDMRFSTTPRGGASGWSEWLKAMKLVARLPTGVPPEFRKKLWLTLAEQHLKVKGVDWNKAEKNCFSEWTNPDDTELGVQIVKDLHRTGCSLFCGSEGVENQAVLKRVLLAYARWNKGVGYCQGFNMLAALILEVMDRSESDSLKVMIYLIEAVLPEGYFANNLRGLSVDMAVFRDLLKLRLPRLSAHLDKLQKSAAEGSVYEPPLTNVFTMQWFLTLFCNCLPHDTVLRVWDLAFLEGDAVLLTTALAIWENLQDRILKVESADEFYSVMGELARETLEASPSKGEQLIASAAKFSPIPELPKLRDKHRYNITPWAHSVQSAARKGLRLFYTEDEVDSSDEGDKLAITTAYGLQGDSSASRRKSALVAAGVFGHPDREKLALDISALKQQYERLRERQRQAHIILAAACARQSHVTGGGPGPMSMNNLLLGKSAIVSNRGRRLGPPQGAIPPSRSKGSKSSSKSSSKAPAETISWTEENQKKKSNRRESIKWKDIKQSSVHSDEGDPEEVGQQISDSEVNEIMQSSMRTRRRSESSSYSECSESSTSTSLCDEPNRMSDFDSEPASGSDNVPVFPDDTLESNVSKDFTENEETKSDNESCVYKNDKEFGAYIQEFEDLLDRTNSMDVDRGLICVLPENESNIDENITELYVNSTVHSQDNDSDVKNNKLSDSDDNNLTSDVEEKDEKVSNLLVYEFESNNTLDAENPIPSYDSFKINKYIKDTSPLETTPLEKTAEIATNNDNEDTKISSNVNLEDINKDNNEDLKLNNAITPENNNIKIKSHPITKEILETDNVIDDTIKTTMIDKPLVFFANESIKVDKEKSPKKEFNDYMDSIRGEQLRSYLNEFKKAEYYSCNVERESTDHILQKASSIDETLFNDDQEVASICDETRNADKDDTATIITASSIEYRSTSGDRSISSSLSSVSPILRSTPGLIEDKPSFISYKSPCRENELPIDIDEDEKPIVLKIDKYFEHSPEFFGARKAAHLAFSSDEEDDKYSNNRRGLSHKSKFSSTSKNDHHRLYLHDFKNEKNQETSDTKAFINTESISSYKDIDKYETTYKSNVTNVASSPVTKTEKTFLALKSPDTFRHKRISSLDSPLSVKYLTKQDPCDSSPLFDESPNISTKYSDYGRSVLEKTKSEELPNKPQTKSFSVLDDEIDAIRSGRRNSERALKIIQENSNILHSILVNQVSKCHVRETVPEELLESSEDIHDDIKPIDPPFLNKKNVRILVSPRSASFDDRLLKSEITTSRYSTEPTDDFRRADILHKDSSRFITSPSTTKNLYEKEDFNQRISEKRCITPRPKSFESHILLDTTDSDDDYKKYVVKKTTTFDREIEENKTDRFGWENKGFEAKQRYSSIYKDESSKHELPLETKPSYTFDFKYTHASEPKILSPKSPYKTDDDFRPETTRISRYKLDPESSSAAEKKSSLTSVSETILNPSDCKSRDPHESSISDSHPIVSEFNISPTYKHSYKSSDISSYANSSYKNLKINELHPPHLADNVSGITESSPIDNSYSKPDILKFETSHSSDLCIISSSMSFSFDPSVEDHTSSKPGTFNSSDTLCQLTSLDQVSTPISPKATMYSSKDLQGVSHGDLALELDRFKRTSDDISYKHDTYSDTFSASLRTPTSPLSNKDKNGIVKSPDKNFSPFPTRNSGRQPKDLGLRLGLYKDSIKSPSK